jgi:hypothetical protein
MASSFTDPYTKIFAIAISKISSFGWPMNSPRDHRRAVAVIVDLTTQDGRKDNPFKPCFRSPDVIRKCVPNRDRAGRGELFLRDNVRATRGGSVGRAKNQKIARVGINQGNTQSGSAERFSSMGRCADWRFTERIFCKNGLDVIVAASKAHAVAAIKTAHFQAAILSYTLSSDTGRSHSAKLY